MKTMIILITILSLIILVGCDGNVSLYKGITDAEIPDDCINFKEDVCELFDCMVDRCWCKEGPDQILYEQEGISITSEEEAISYVQKYVDKSYTVTRAFELNDIFYNVFADDAGNEVVYTVAVDGTIIKTICGI